MSIYEMHERTLTPIDQTKFKDANIFERTDLQRMLRDQIDVIASDVLVISEEYGNWEGSSRRIDLLGVDRDANLVVIELKRTEDGGHMELQALRYAAMVSTLSFEKAVETYQQFLNKRTQSKYRDAREDLKAYINWDEREDFEFGKKVRIILVSSNFSKELTTAVLWLNNNGLDICCYRAIPYSYNEKTLLDIQQIIPLPEAADYQIKIGQKVQEERQANALTSALLSRFWQSFISLSSGKLWFSDRLKEYGRPYIGSPRVARGINYYIMTRKHGWRVELYIDTNDKDENKRIFDWFENKKVEIENSYGAALSWERLDDSRGSRIAVRSDGGGYRDDENKWPAIQTEMIAAIAKLENAFKQPLSELEKTFS